MMANDGGLSAATRHGQFLAAVQKARAKVIVAELELINATKTAAAGGVTADEIAGAIRMIERRAGLR